MKELRAMSEVELLQTHSAIIGELRRRKVVKTENNPLGDYTEWLVCKRLKLEVADKNLKRHTMLPICQRHSVSNQGEAFRS